MAGPDLAALDILMVDDHDPTRAILERMLRAAGAQRIRTADDAARALATLAEQPAALIITDHQMPGMDGLELIAAIRADPKLAHARTLLVTGYAEVTREAQAAGADAVLVKPIEAAALLGAIQQMLARH